MFWHFICWQPQGATTVSSSPSTPEKGIDLLEAAAIGRDEVVQWIENHAKPNGVVGDDMAHGQQALIKEIWVSFRALPPLNESLDKALAHKKELIGQVNSAIDFQSKKMMTLPAEHKAEMENRLELWKANKMRTSENDVIQAHQELNTACKVLETKIENLLTNLDVISSMGPPHPDPEVRSIVGELESLFSELSVSEPPMSMIPEELPMTKSVPTDVGHGNDALQVQTSGPMDVDPQKKVGWLNLLSQNMENEVFKKKKNIYIYMKECISTYPII